jgi:uncharacterized membrane protein SpoIIM required for sporulation
LSRAEEEAVAMSWTIVLLLVGFWVLGLLNGYSFGGLIHILLVYAGLMVTARLIERRRRHTGQSTPRMQPFEPLKPLKD